MIMTKCQLTTVSLSLSIYINVYNSYYSKQVLVCICTCVTSPGYCIRVRLVVSPPCKHSNNQVDAFRMSLPLKRK